MCALRTPMTSSLSTCNYFPSHFKWIIVYQCHLTKFCIIWPLTSKRAAEVAIQLLDIFLLFGAPCNNQLPSHSRLRKGDPRNILGVSIDLGDNNLYTIAVKTGILINVHATNSTYAQTPSIPVRHQPRPTDISLPCIKTLATGGQGFVWCDCCSLFKKYTSNRCKCYKAK